MKTMDELQDSMSGELSSTMFTEDNSSSPSWVHLPNRPTQDHALVLCPMCFSLVDQSRLFLNAPSAVNYIETHLDQSELLVLNQSIHQLLSNPEEGPLDLSVNGPNGRAIESNECTVVAKCVDAGRAATPSPHCSDSNSSESTLKILNAFISDALEQCKDEFVLSGKILEELSSRKSMLKAKINNESTSCESGCQLQSINPPTSNSIERNNEEKVPTHSPENSWPFSFHQPTQQPRLSEWLNAEISMNTQTDATSSSHEDDMEEDSTTHHQGFQEAQHHNYNPYSQL